MSLLLWVSGDYSLVLWLIYTCLNGSGLSAIRVYHFKNKYILYLFSGGTHIGPNVLFSLLRNIELNIFNIFPIVLNSTYKDTSL